VGAWANFGTPRISYGGYQVGLAFYKATLQDFGPPGSATVIRDRLIGIFFGLIVYGIIDNLLWPVRAADRMREGLADMLRELADLAKLCTGNGAADPGKVDALRRLTSHQVAEVQGLIESSKFEPGGAGLSETVRVVGDAQSVFLVLLALCHGQEGSPPLPDVVRESTKGLGVRIAASLTALAEGVHNRVEASAVEIDEALDAVDRSFSEWAGGYVDAAEEYRTRLTLCREMVAAVKRLSLDARGLSLP
jgi:multidrug resistance protein MdtO